MSGQVKVFFVTERVMTELMRGEVRLQLPGDAEVQAIDHIRGKPLYGMRVWSASFPNLPHGAQIPARPATVIRPGITIEEAPTI